jgi:hypothetical protein
LGLIMALALLLTGCGLIQDTLYPPTEAPLPAQAAAPPEPSALPGPPTLTAAPAPTDPPPATLTPTAAPVLGPEAFPPGVDPLTGLPVADPAVLERRPMAIKVTNFPRSVRPQWGLSRADHVFEYYIGDSFSRFIGIFYGTDVERVGPVRSARPFDEQVTRMYRALFVFGFADDKVMQPWMESDLKNFLVVEREINGVRNCPPLCRIGAETNYNTLFANTADLTTYARDLKINEDRQNLSGLVFDPLRPPGGQVMDEIRIRWTRVAYNRWQYDPATKRYLRFQETQEEDLGKEYTAHIDSLTGEQLAADNLIVLLAPYGYYFHSTSTSIYEVPLTGEGRGYALREGTLYPIRWTRPAVDQIVRLSYPDGRPFALKPGNVWYEMLSDLTTVDRRPDGIWRFLFDLPEYVAPTPTPKKGK